jgi:hypothetical protein
MGTNTKTYPFSPQEASAIAQRIRQAGGPVIDPTKPTGEAVTHNVHLAWQITANQIAFSIENKPWYISEAVIWDQLDKLLAGA